MSALEIDPSRIQIVPTSEYEASVCYGNLHLLTQHVEDWGCQVTRTRAIAAGISLLEWRWQHASEHRRLTLLAAIQGE